jgi:hypothetical protein
MIPFYTWQPVISFGGMDVVERDEKHDVEVWRQEKLEEAGFPRLVAYGIATRPDVDYHRALEMFRKGCPPETAAKILY